GSPFSKNDYLDLLILLSQVFKLMRSKGMLELESHIENPSNSSIFSQHRSFMRNKHAVTFFCDYLRILTMGVDDHMQVEDLMDQDLETHHKEHEDISHAVLMMGDAMPALGIVAAVLGVIITMRSITEPPEILGMLIGSALVGTFLGVLLSYTLVSPIGRFIGSYFQAEDKYLECIKCALLSHMKGNAPAISIEFARNNIPPKERPDFFEVENAVSNSGTGAAA
ncbi:MAG: flagellar motor stator protein MotA, partial [Alphaproteobacteria bacterium]|nr:flagellar motor stator protein MotA [Alphaproteobacteria bacterium]